MRFRKELKMKNIKDKMVTSIEEVAKEVDMQEVVEINFKINHDENSILVGIKERANIKVVKIDDGEHDSEHDGIIKVGSLEEMFKEAGIVADFFKLVKSKAREDSKWIDTINETFLDLKERGNERFEIQIKNGDNLS
jgi:hypothetical protein